MSEKLKPCPLCGCKQVGWRWIETHSLDSSYAVIRCDDCECSIPADCDSRITEQDIRDWNTRPDSPESINLEMLEVIYLVKQWGGFGNLEITDKVDSIIAKAERRV